MKNSVVLMPVSQQAESTANRGTLEGFFLLLQPPGVINGCLELLLCRISPRGFCLDGLRQTENLLTQVPDVRSSAQQTPLAFLLF